MTSEAMNELFKFTEPQPIVLSLMFKPGKSLADSEVTMAIELPTTGLVSSIDNMNYLCQFCLIVDRSISLLFRLGL